MKISPVAEFNLQALSNVELVEVYGGDKPSSSSGFWYDIAYAAGWLLEKALEGAQAANSVR